MHPRNERAESRAAVGWAPYFSQTVPRQSQRHSMGDNSEETNNCKNDRIGLQHWARQGNAGYISYQYVQLTYNNASSRTRRVD